MTPSNLPVNISNRKSISCYLRISVLKFYSNITKRSTSLFTLLFTDHVPKASFHLNTALETAYKTFHCLYIRFSLFGLHCWWLVLQLKLLISLLLPSWPINKIWTLKLANLAFPSHLFCYQLAPTTHLRIRKTVIWWHFPALKVWKQKPGKYVAKQLRSAVMREIPSTENW